MQGYLSICATPIGNLEDITLRVLRTLKEADYIAAEDTRQTIKLLNHFDIHTPMISYHKFNEEERSEQLIRMMQEGSHIALVSDAGTPGISDPGAVLVRKCYEAGVPVTSLPGASAVITALTLSGLMYSGFIFEGFLPQDKKELKETLDRSVHCAGLCSMIIATDNEQVKKNSWEFLKWWTSSEAQVRFGREIESVLGSSARYTTANREALDQLAWSAAQLSVLKEQMAQTVGFREIAGGYSTTRHMTNAIRRVINDKDDARETLLMYSKTINEEIKVKRREFNLPVD